MMYTKIDQLVYNIVSEVKNVLKINSLLHCVLKNISLSIDHLINRHFGKTQNLIDWEFISRPYLFFQVWGHFSRRGSQKNSGTMERPIL